MDNGGGFFGATGDEDSVATSDLVEGGCGDGESFSGSGRSVTDGEGVFVGGTEELLLGRTELGGRVVVGGRPFDFVGSGDWLREEGLQGGREIGGGLGEERFQLVKEAGHVFRLFGQDKSAGGEEDGVC